WTPGNLAGANQSNLAAGTYTITVTDANGCTATATTTITQPTQLTVTIPASTNVSCNGGSNGAATAAAAGGTVQYNYSWSNSQTGANATGLTAGSYTVYVTDANGCTAQASVTITQPTAIVLNTSFTQSTCGNPNGSASVTASGGAGGYQYSWNTGATTATISNIASNIYTVVVTDANGCTATTTVNVPNAGSPAITIVSQVNVLCFGGNNGSATANATGGTPGYTYNWSNSQTGPTATGLVAGTYTVIVTDANNCAAQTTVTITEPAQLTVSATGTNVSCFGGNNGTAAATASGGTTAYSYLWSNGDTNANATGLIAGTYTVVVTDANGCTAQTTVTITEPTQLILSTAGFATTCFGAANGQGVVIPSGGTLPYSYSWSPVAGSTPSLTGLTAGTYTVCVTDANGCSACDTAIVTQPTQIVLSTATTPALCGNANGTATVTATGGSGGYTYSWNNGQTAANATNLLPNTYTVWVTDANGCTDSATAIVTTPAPLTISISATNVSCFGGSNGTATVVVGGGTTPYTYLWNNSGSTASISNLTIGTYSVIVTDQNGCSITAQVAVTQPTLLTTTTSNASYCVGSGGTVAVLAQGGTPGYTYSWSGGLGSNSSASVSPTATTTYTVWVTDANNCTAVDSSLVTVNTAPVISFYASDSSGCAPLCVTFTNNTPGSVTVNWSTTDNGATGSGNTWNHCYNNPGSYDVTITVTDNNGCSSTQTAVGLINVYGNPVADFTLSPQPTTILNPEICFTNTSINADTYTWDFGDPYSNAQNNSSNLEDVCHVYSDTGTYCVKLIAATVNGCVDSVTYCLVIGPDFTFYAPNAFTPDGDGTNDLWAPTGIGIDESEYELWIFDRWGDMIWMTDVWGKGWDGRANGGDEIAQIDTYVWKVKVKDLFGNMHVYVGHVSIIK
ncbi:MAG: PKD domain-containing protein, partial [Bacteroidota bacterium]